MRYLTIARLICCISLIALASAGASMANASLAGAAPDGEETWTSIGPQGGSIYSLAIDPLAPSTVFAGTYLGGVYKSTNAGASWAPSNTGLGNFTVYSVLVDPHTPSTVFARTAGGLFKSANGGGNWSLLDTTDIFFNVYKSVVMDPLTPTTLYGSGGLATVYKTTNGGGAWLPADTGLPDDGVLLAIDPLTPAILYAVSDGNTIYKSTTGGGSWSRIDDGDLSHAGSGDAIYVDPVTTSTLYLIADSGVWKSTDSGANWTPASTGLDMTVKALAIDPLAPATLYAAGGGYLGGVYKSINGGQSWFEASDGLYAPTGLPHAFATALAIHPSTPSTLFVGLWDNVSPGQTVLGGGIYKSTNSAGSWSAANSSLKNTNIGSLAVHPTDVDVIYGGTYPGGAYKTADGGGSWSWTPSGLLGVSDIASIVIDPLTPSTLYIGAASCGVYKSINDGVSFTPVNTGLNSGYGCALVRDLAINPQNPQVLYAGSTSGIYKTTNGGSNWSVVNTGLPSGINVESLAIDPLSPDTLYAGAYLKGVYKTIDGGDHWVAASTGMGPLFFPTVYDLAVNPVTPSILYAATPDKGVFKSTNGGDSWALANTGLPVEPTFGYIHANALAIDPATPTTLYVGMGSGPNSQTYPEWEGGVFKSIDSGANWAPVETGLADFYINELAISPAAPTTIFAATQGGGIFEIHAASEPPAAFNKISPFNLGGGVSVTLSLTWGPSNRVNHYEYCLKTSGPCDNSGPWTGVGKDTSVALPALLPDTTYFWQVRARNTLSDTYANGSVSGGWSFTTGDGQGAEIYLPVTLR